MSRSSECGLAFLYTVDGWPIGPCHVEVVSMGGAQVTHAIADEVPQELILSLSRNRQVRRHCQVV